MGIGVAAPLLAGQWDRKASEALTVSAIGATRAEAVSDAYHEATKALLDARQAEADRIAQRADGLIYRFDMLGILIDVWA